MLDLFCLLDPFQLTITENFLPQGFTWDTNSIKGTYKNIGKFSFLIHKIHTFYKDFCCVIYKCKNLFKKHTH